MNSDCLMIFDCLTILKVINRLITKRMGKIPEKTISLFLKSGKFSTLMGDVLKMTTDYKFDTNRFSGCKTEYKIYKKNAFRYTCMR